MRCRGIVKGQKCQEQATPSGAHRFCFKCACEEFGKDQSGWPLTPHVEDYEQYAIYGYGFWCFGAVACLLLVLGSIIL